MPPDATLAPSVFQYGSVLATANMRLNWSLNAKFSACVGKYRITLGTLPRHREPMPSPATVLLKQSPMPLYGSARRPCLIISSWFWMSSSGRRGGEGGGGG